MGIHDNVLAIDPALSTTGYAIINYDQTIKEVGKFRTSPKYSEEERIHAITKALYDQTKVFHVNDVVLEDGYIGANAKTGLQLASLRGAIIEVFKWNSCSISINHMKPSEIRYMFGQKGNSSKEEIAKAVISFYGEDNKFIADIGPYSDKQNKHKTSDIYDAISIGLAYIRSKQSKLK